MLKKILNTVIGKENYKDLARKIAKHIENRDKTFTVRYRVSDENQLLKDIENAEWFLDTISPYYFHDIEMRSWVHNIEGSSSTIYYEVSYHTNMKDDEFVNRQVRKIIEEINPRNKTAFEIVAAVNDFFCEQFQYEIDTEHSPYIPFTILLERKGVCQGFALLALKILKEIGIPVQYVSGYANSGRHAWNIVQIEEDWYHIDFTWNLAVNNSNDGFNYTYFLLSDDEILKDHDFDTHYYPACVSDQYAFMKNTNAYAIHDGVVFFANELDNYKLYIKNLKTNQSAEKFLNVRVQGLSYYNSQLYFSNYSDCGFLYSYHLIDLQLKKLSSFEIRKTVINQGYLYVKLPNGSTKRLNLQNK